MSRVTRLPHRGTDRHQALAEVDAMAWLLDNSIPVPLTGGRRVGIDAIIGLVPFVGDLIGGGMGLFIVWRASRHGLPRIVVARMLANTAVDMMVGLIPFLGDAFDLWFKANTRNLGLMRGFVEEPGRSTRSEWLAMGAMIGAVIGILVLIGWVIWSAVSGFIEFMTGVVTYAL
jgi:Domain of unknown function (DUF4112)